MIDLCLIILSYKNNQMCSFMYRITIRVLCIDFCSWRSHIQRIVITQQACKKCYVALNKVQKKNITRRKLQYVRHKIVCNMKLLNVLVLLFHTVKIGRLWCMLIRQNRVRRRNLTLWHASGCLLSGMTIRIKLTVSLLLANIKTFNRDSLGVLPWPNSVCFTQRVDPLLVSGSVHQDILS